MFDVVSKLYCVMKRNPLAHEAAQEIERLRKRVQELEGQPVPLSEWQKMEAELAQLREMQGEAVGVVVDTFDGYTKVRMHIPQPSGTLLYVSVPSNEVSDQVCQDEDGCPTELAVLKRFWRDAKRAQSESTLAWETGSGNGLIRYVTDAKYQKFSDTIKQYYRPYTGKMSADD